MNGDAKKIAFIACVNDEEMYEESVRYLHHLEVPQGFSVELVPVYGASSMTAGYEAARDHGALQGLHASGYSADGEEAHPPYAGNLPPAPRSWTHRLCGLPSYPGQRRLVGFEGVLWLGLACS